MKKHGKRKKYLAILSLLFRGFLTLALYAFLQGCLPSSPANPRQAPVLDSTQLNASARRREQYEKYRPAAPSEYRVFPIQQKDNSFGEFDANHFRGLDPQAELPPLPIDLPSPPGGAEVFFPGASTLSRSEASRQPRQAEMRALSAAASTAPAGITVDRHFYPIEQLVYGGDYPDIDKAELYRLMPNDVITITIWDHPELSGQVKIQPDGTIGIPNAPDLVRVRGLTVDEAAEAVRQVVSVYVKGECRVRIQANRARGGYYFIFGDVLQPGRFPMGFEPVRLSDAVLAANWEANPARRDMDGDEFSPSFPAASPRGRYLAPQTADLARVMLITPHRSQPIRTFHDVRSAMLGITANDPIIRPGQIIVVPALDPTRNENLGRIGGPPAYPTPAYPEGSGWGFSRTDSPARLPEVLPPPPRNQATVNQIPPRSAVETNMTSAFETSFNQGVESM
ncbi:MAG: polysaccharide biosynthesis/export family protein, partial [Planctomycetes bacterium]|nr:polysaccharide biosynthesis/export family protein [Planctomycetota bacterium]